MVAGYIFKKECPQKFFHLLFLVRREHSYLATLLNASIYLVLQVLDRLCLVGFTTTTVLLSAAVLIAAPHIIVV